MSFEFLFLKELMVKSHSNLQEYFKIITSKIASITEYISTFRKVKDAHAFKK